MSYILDALRKGNTEAQEKLADVDFSKADIESYVSDKAANTITINVDLMTKVTLILIVLLASMVAGYLFGGGYKIMQQKYAYSGSSADIEPTINSPEMEALAVSLASDETNLVEFFTVPDKYNKSHVSAKKIAFEQQQQQLITEQKLQQQAEQQALAEQVEQVIKAQGLVVSNKADPTAHVISAEAKAPVKYTLNEDELTGVSPDLLEKFQQALTESNEELDATANVSTATKPKKSNVTQELPTKVKPLALMSIRFRDSVPRLRFSLHMYTSNPADSWVRLNEKDYFTGDVSDEEVVIEEILPQQVILQYQGQRFSLKALANW
ncbi:general secretion pathway protein GspB [Colwelliaceae bacterium BS250]